MKNLFYTLAVFSLLFVSCSNENEAKRDLTQEEKNEIIAVATEFADVHNDCLSYIMNKMNTAGNSTMSKISDRCKQVINSIG